MAPFLLLATMLQGATVIDRIAVIVGQHVIKLSDIERDIRLTAFLNREKPVINSASRHQAAERLIDQEIVRQEIVTGGYRRPDEAQAEALEKQLMRDRFQGSRERLDSALAKDGLTPKELRAHLLWQLTVLRFIDERFRPAVFVSDDDLRTYYDQHTEELRKQYPGKSSFEDLQSTIRNDLEGEQINQNFDTWLKAARKRTRIEYKQDAFA